MIGKYLQKFRSSDTYLRLRHSRLHQFYFKWAHSASYFHIKAEQQMYSQLLQQYFPDKDILVFDGGANIGDLTQTFSKLAKQTIAIEPDPANLRHLDLRYSGQSNIHVLPVALGAQNGKQSFYTNTSDPALSTLHPRENYHFESKTVEVRTMHSLIAQFGHPDFVKLDLEGSEFEVIQSMDQMPKLMAFEVNAHSDPSAFARALDMIQEKFTSLSYNISTNDEDLIFEDFVQMDQLLDFISKNSCRYGMVFCLSR